MLYSSLKMIVAMAIPTILLAGCGDKEVLKS